MSSERRGRRPSAANQPVNQLPWSQPHLTLEPARILSDDQIAAIHRQSLQVLEEIGMDMLLAEAREILACAGARVDGERVRIGSEIVEHALTTALSEFTIHARNPVHDMRIRDRWIAFGPVGGPPNCSDLDRGRRPGTLADNGDLPSFASSSTVSTRWATVQSTRSTSIPRSGTWRSCATRRAIQTRYRSSTRPA